jgi:beta-lactamase regulating signal transducer with metallopeptidase domain
MAECLLGMMLTGSGAYLLWAAQCRVTGERFSARWQYRLLKVVMGFFLLPVGLLVGAILWPVAAVEPAGMPVGAAVGGVTISPVPAEGVRTPGGEISAEAVPVSVDWAAAVPLLRGLWLAGALALGGRELLRYGRFRRRFLRRCVPDERPETAAALAVCLSGGRRRLRVWRAPLPCSPFVTGLVRPVIVLPPGEAEAGALRCVLRHELHHIRQGDLWVRMLALAVRVVFWFDPLVWRLGRQVAEWSELACDEAVAAALGRGERRLYGQVILQAALRSAEGAGAWATSLAARETMKRRLTRMLYGREMRRRTKMAAALVLAVIVAGGCVLAAGTYWPAAETAEAPVLDGKEPGAAAPVVTPGGSKAAEPAKVVVQPAVEPERSTGQPAQNAPEDGAGAPVRSETAPADGTRYPVAGPAEREALIDALVAEHGLDRADFIVHINQDDDSEVVEVYRNATHLAELAAEYLVDGQWPRNSRGESYGPSCLEEITGTEPDLVAAVGTDGRDGYIRESDKWHSKFDIRSPEEAEVYMAFINALGAYDIPLYDAEGAVIGQFRIAGGVPKPEELRWMLTEMQGRLGLTEAEIEAYVQGVG